MRGCTGARCNSRQSHVGPCMPTATVVVAVATGPQAQHRVTRFNKHYVLLCAVLTVAGFPHAAAGTAIV